MTPPILFLDFDGVLHPNLCPPRQWFTRLPLLAEALAGSDVQLVISSSWRFHHDYGALARRFPPALRLQLAGMTGEAVVGRHARHREIIAWLQRHAPSTLASGHWRALDDAAFEFPADCPQLVACDGATGMTAAEVALLRRWLS